MWSQNVLAQVYLSSNHSKLILLSGATKEIAGNQQKIHKRQTDGKPVRKRDTWDENVKKNKA